MEHFKFNPNCCLVNLSNSILAHYNIEPFHNTLKPLDDILKNKPYKKIALLLFDGLGKSIKEKHLNETDGLRSKVAFEITSIFPPTTVAATTSVLSAKYPLETGWMGWSQYFKQYNTAIDVFLNVDSYTKNSISTIDIPQTYLKYESIIDILNKNHVLAKAIFPFGINGGTATNLDEYCNSIRNTLLYEEEVFIYAYWAEPDHSIHTEGTDTPHIKQIVKEINKKVMKLASKHKDTLFIVLADHSLINTQFYVIDEHEDFFNTLKHLGYLDSRSTFFDVKEGQEKLFEELFNKYYGQEFVLKTKEEVINEHLFGYGTPHPLFNDFLGDYLATAISNKGFNYNLIKDGIPMLASHSGSVEEESIISVAILNK